MVDAQRENIEDAYPLSPLQHGMLFHSVASETTGIYLEQIVVEISNTAFSLQAFQASWQYLLDRHPILRSAFVWKGLADPLQIVQKKVSLDWTVYDWRTYSTKEREEKLTHFKSEDAHQSFPLNNAPLMRMCVIRVSESDYIWIWTRHHILADGWSTSLLLSELKKIYRALSSNNQPNLDTPPPYRNYIGWLGLQDKSLQQKYWQHRLRGFTTPSYLGIEQQPIKNHQAGEFHQLGIKLGKSIFTNLKNICAENALTLNALIQTAWCLALSRYSGESDIVWGATVSGRPPDLQEVEKTVGLFINTIPQRAIIDWNVTLLQFLQDFQKQHLQSIDYSHSDQTDILGWSDCANETGLFHSVVVYENYPKQLDKDNQADSIGLQSIEFNEKSNFPLALIALPEDTLELILIFDTAIYTSAAMRRLLGQLECLLSSMIAGFNSPLHRLSFLPEDEIEILTTQWNRPITNNTDTTFIDQLILDQAAKTPDATAITCGNEVISYQNLQSISDRYLQLILQHPANEDSMIAICLPRGGDCIVWMLSALRSGAGYLVLDPKYPAQRLQSMLTNSQAKLLITTSEYQQRFRTYRHDILLSDQQPTLGTLPPTTVENRASSDTAYLLYTSGSSGNPKGVVVSHQNLVSSTKARNAFYASPPSSYLLLSSFSFDSSVAGIYWTLTTGGKLVISEPGQEQEMHSLLQIMDKEQVSHTLCLPTLYQALLDHARDHHQQHLLNSVDVVICAGEALSSTSLIEDHRKLNNKAQLINEYGPTEATVWCSAYDATDHYATSAAPIGKPIANTQLFVLDHREQLRPIGAVGELVITGTGVTNGYLHNHEATESVFRRHECINKSNSIVYHTGDLVKYQEDGNLVFLGRKDEQIKIRGYRVDPIEIEEYLCQHPDITDAKVIPHKETNDRRLSSTVLFAFITTNKDDVETASIDTFLGQWLPAHQIPQRYIFTLSFPQLANGKLDRQGLVALIDNANVENVAQYREAETQIQKTLVKIWSDVLGYPKIGIDDNFFALGGDSIKSIRVVSGLLKEGYQIGPLDIFQSPTISALSRCVQTNHPDKLLAKVDIVSTEKLTQIQSRYGKDVIDAYPLTDNQRSFLFAHISDPKNDPGNMQFRGTLEGGLDFESLEAACAQVVKEHHALRSTIHWDKAGLAEQVVHNECKVTIDCIENASGSNQEEINEYLEKQKAMGIDLGSFPTWKILLFKKSATKHDLFWCFHHSLIDGWSASIVLSRVVEIYQQKIQGNRTDSLPCPQFNSYVQWQEQSKSDKDQEYWSTKSAHLNARYNAVLPTASLNRSSRVGVVNATLLQHELSSLQQDTLSGKNTIAQIIQTIWAYCLYQSSNDAYIGFYSTVSGRNIALQGVDEMVGQFATHLPFIVDTGDLNSFEKLSTAIIEQSDYLRSCDHLSPLQIEQWCDFPCTTPVAIGEHVVGLQSLVMVENFPYQESVHNNHLNSIRLKALQLRGTDDINLTHNISTHCPLLLTVSPQPDQLDIRLYFDVDIFGESNLQHLLDTIKNVLSHWKDDQFQPLINKMGQASKQLRMINPSTLKINKHLKSADNLPSHRPLNAMEKSLLAIWQNVLNIKISHVTDDFFQLGGNSLKALQMAEQIKKLLHIDMPLATLIENRSIEQLALKLSNRQSIDWQTVVGIQNKGSATPLFGVHAEGNILFYHDLARCLGNEQPFYGLQSPELNSEEQHFSSIHDMAANYIKEIKTVQPDGPYNICGMCFGGWVAFEIAQQLTHAGEEVEHLIILDSEGPAIDRQSIDHCEASLSEHKQHHQNDRNAPIYKKAFRHFKNGNLSKVAMTYITATPMIYKLISMSGRKKVEATIADRIKSVRRHQEYLQRKYRTTYYNGDVHFIRSEEFDGMEERKYEIPRWKEICKGDIKLYKVPGDHLNLLEKPQVYKVADTFKKILY